MAPRLSAAAAMLAVVAVTAPLTGGTPAVAAPAAVAVAPATVRSSQPIAVAVRADRRMAVLVNRWRVGHGLGTVRYSAALSQTARPWARNLARSTGRLSHDPAYFSDIRSSCRAASAGAENVAYRYQRAHQRRSTLARRSAQRLLRQYLDSPPHRANIAAPGITHVGVATMVQRTSRGVVYVTNVLRFARADRC